MRTFFDAPISIITYHSISDKGGFLNISPETFKRQIELISLRYEIIRLRDIEKAILSYKGFGHLVIVTFDDAYMDFYEHAYPVLEKYSVPITMFIPTDYIGKINEWDYSRDITPKRNIMNPETIRRLKNGGLVDFGSHTASHCRMSELSIHEMREEAAKSKEVLEDILSINIDMFSYPYGQLGDFSNKTTAVLVEVGYKIAVTTYWGTICSIKNLMHLNRIFFTDYDKDKKIEAKIEGFYNWISWKHKLGFAKRVAKKVLNNIIPYNGGAL